MQAIPFNKHTQRLWQALLVLLLLASACHLPQHSPHLIRLSQASGARVQVNLKLSSRDFQTQASQSGYAETVLAEIEALRVFLVDSAGPPTGVLSPINGSLVALNPPLATHNLVFEHVPAGNIWACAAAFTDETVFNAGSNRTAPLGTTYTEGNCICSDTGGQGSGSILIDANLALPGGGPFSPLGISLQLRHARAATLASEIALSDGLKMSFSYIPPGSFSMGDLLILDATPPRFTTLTQGFYLQTTELTQGQWLAVMGDWPPASPPTNGIGDNYPMHNVSWNDVQVFLTELNSRSSDVYRLPTEAEWEYAARAGSTTDLSCDIQAPNCPNNYVWYNSTANGSHQPVATLRPNPWGLYDMHGNVAEWVSDWYAFPYDSSDDEDPPGPSGGSYKVYRGGISGNSIEPTYSASRSLNVSLGAPANQIEFIGFRLVRELP